MERSSSLRTPDGHGFGTPRSATRCERASESRFAWLLILLLSMATIMVATSASVSRAAADDPQTLPTSLR